MRGGAGARPPPSRRSNREYFVARFDDGAREVMVEAQNEADSLQAPVPRHRAPDARARRSAGSRASTYDAAREQVIEQAGEGDERGSPGMPRPFTPRAKRVLEAALNDAADAGREQFGPDDILLALVSDSRGVGGEVLRDLGVTAEQLRAQPASVAAAAASPPPFTRTSRAAARAAASASSAPAIASPRTAPLASRPPPRRRARPCRRRARPCGAAARSSAARASSDPAAR